MNWKQKVLIKIEEMRQAIEEETYADDAQDTFRSYMDDINSIFIDETASMGFEDDLEDDGDIEEDEDDQQSIAD